MSAPWSYDEERILVLTYPDHGPVWIGYESALPGRTPQSIASKAKRLGLTVAQGSAPPPKVACSERDEHVFSLMGRGVPTSEIDRMLQLPNGTARSVVVGRWSNG